MTTGRQSALESGTTTMVKTSPIRFRLNRAKGVQIPANGFAPYAPHMNTAIGTAPEGLNPKDNKRLAREQTGTFYLDMP
jgi:hypothetical protein